MGTRLDGKNAVVTGGARGIGRAIVSALIQEGASVAVWDLLPRPSWCDEVTSLHYLQGDVASPAEVAAMTNATDRAFGHTDILVNDAGFVRQEGFDEITVDNWRRVIDVNLTAVYLCCHAFTRAMRDRQEGRIINIASQIGQIGGTEMVHYCAAKAGVIGLTKALARELAPYNVLVNAVAPGLIETDMTKDVEPAWRAAKLSQLPLGRYGEPREVADAVVFLAAESGTYFVGQTLGPNGGDVML